MLERTLIVTLDALAATTHQCNGDTKRYKSFKEHLEQRTPIGPPPAHGTTRPGSAATVAEPPDVDMPAFPDWGVLEDDDREGAEAAMGPKAREHYALLRGGGWSKVIRGGGKRKVAKPP